MCASELYREVMFGAEQSGATVWTEVWIRCCFDRRFCCTSHSPYRPVTLYLIQF